MTPLNHNLLEIGLIRAFRAKFPPLVQGQCLCFHCDRGYLDLIFFLYTFNLEIAFHLIFFIETHFLCQNLESQVFVTLPLDRDSNVLHGDEITASVIGAQQVPYYLHLCLQLCSLDAFIFRIVMSSCVLIMPSKPHSRNSTHASMFPRIETMNSFTSQDQKFALILVMVPANSLILLLLWYKSTSRDWSLASLTNPP